MTGNSRISLRRVNPDWLNSSTLDLTKFIWFGMGVNSDDFIIHMESGSNKIIPTGYLGHKNILTLNRL